MADATGPERGVLLGALGVADEEPRKDRRVERHGGPPLRRAFTVGTRMDSERWRRERNLDAEARNIGK